MSDMINKFLVFLKHEYPDLSGKWERFLRNHDADSPASPESDIAPPTPIREIIDSSPSEMSCSEQESDHGEFTTVISKKTKKRKHVEARSSSSVLSSPTKAIEKPKPKARKTTAETPAPSVQSYRAAPLAATSSAPQAPQNSQNTQAPTASEYKPKNPPPVVIQEKIKWNEISTAINANKLRYKTAKSTQEGIKVQVETPQDHRLLTSFLRDRQIGYHTYALEDERNLRVVILGVDTFLSEKEVLDDIQKQGFPALEIHRMYHPVKKFQYKMVLVVLPLTPEGKEIFNIRTVCNISGIRVEAPRKRGTPGQCHRCQLYGHSARNCHAKPRCVKCLDDHGTADCPRKNPAEESEPPSCVLCKSKGHPANYRGCSKAPKIKRRPAPQNKKAPAKQRFVDAPPPTHNPWLTSTQEKNPMRASEFPALPTKNPPPTAAKKPTPPAKMPTPPAKKPASTAFSSLDYNLAFARHYLEKLNSINADELQTFVNKILTGADTPVSEHKSLVDRIMALTPSNH